MVGMSPSCLAVIPARGGSKGVPRKNVRLLAGRPLVAHAIVAARGARGITRTVVSTDDEEIAQVTQDWGAEVVKRPDELSGDQATSESAVLHALESLRLRENYEPELVMLIQCTSPLTISNDLDKLMVDLLEKGADSAFTACPFGHFLWREVEGRAQGVNHEGARRKRRQDLAPQYLETGAAYVMRTARFIETGERFCGRSVLSISPAERCLEIDDPADFIRAEAFMRARSAGGT